MTAQCKVLHLLFSQSDYPKIECHIIQSVRVCVFYSCVITERSWWPSETTDGWSESSLEWHWDEVLLLCLFLVMWPLKVSLPHTATDCYWILCLPPKISGEESPSWTLTFWISRHIHSAAHTVSISVRNTKQWPQFCVDKTLFWYETLIKGRAIRTQGSLEYQTVKTDAQAGYNIEQLKGCDKIFAWNQFNSKNKTKHCFGTETLGWIHFFWTHGLIAKPSQALTTTCMSAWCERVCV